MAEFVVSKSDNDNDNCNDHDKCKAMTMTMTMTTAISLSNHVCTESRENHVWCLTCHGHVDKL